MQKVKSPLAHTHHIQKVTLNWRWRRSHFIDDWEKVLTPFSHHKAAFFLFSPKKWKMIWITRYLIKPVNLSFKKRRKKRYFYNDLQARLFFLLWKHGWLPIKKTQCVELSLYIENHQNTFLKNWRHCVQILCSKCNVVVFKDMHKW